MQNTLKTHDLIYFVCVCVLAFGDDNPCGSLATQIFYDFMISSSVISFNTILFYLALYYDVEGKERKTPKQAVASPKMSLLGVLKPTLVIF